MNPPLTQAPKRARKISLNQQGRMLRVGDPSFRVGDPSFRVGDPSYRVGEPSIRGDQECNGGHNNMTSPHVV